MRLNKQDYSGYFCEELEHDSESETDGADSDHEPLTAEPPRKYCLGRDKKKQRGLLHRHCQTLEHGNIIWSFASDNPDSKIGRRTFLREVSMKLENDICRRATNKKTTNISSCHNFETIWYS
jgi:hypothetical protein